MFQRLGEIVSRHWLITIVLWIVVVVVVRQKSPSWDSVTHDGDLAYMPAEMPSVQGEQLLEQAFPDGRSKSEVIIVFSRDDRVVDQADWETIKSFLCRMKNLLGASHFAQHQRWREAAVNAGDTAAQALAEEKANQALELAREAFEEAVEALNSEASMARDAFVANPTHNLALIEAQVGHTSEAQKTPGDCVEFST